MSIAFHIDLPSNSKGIISHSLKLLKNHYDIEIEGESANTILVSDSIAADIRVSDKFIQAMESKEFDHQILFSNGPIIRCKDGTPDYLGSICYMVNFLQEYTRDESAFDHLDRFKYQESYHCRWNCTKENLVLSYIENLMASSKKLRKIARKKIPTTLEFSHDIDILYKNPWPEIKTALSKFDLNSLKLLFLKFGIYDPDKHIFQKIVNTYKKHKEKAIFFWLPNGNVFTAADGINIRNANYKINNEQTQTHIALLREEGFEIALHTSLGGKDITSEIQLLGGNIKSNRNHYLAGKLQSTWHQLEEAGIRKDFSAAFSTEVGFRNSYGLPSQPYDPLNDRPYNLTVHPLHIMDTTLIKKFGTPDSAKSEVVKFLSKHSSDCRISFLFHNNYFSDIKFPGWFTLFESIVSGEILEA